MRRPYPVLIAWTLLALAPMPWLVGAMSGPVAPGCFEWCNVGQELAAIGLRLVGVLWLVAVLVVASSWEDREPTIAAVSALVAGALMLVVALRIYGIVSFEIISEDFLFLAWVLGLGLQLPPVWRLAKRTNPSTPLRLVVGTMGVAVTIAALALAFLGTNQVWDAGPNVIFATWIAFVLGLIAVTVAAWRHGVARPSVIGPLLFASLPILVFPVGVAAPGVIGYVVFLPIPLSAIAWSWIAVGWLPGRRASG